MNISRLSKLYSMVACCLEIFILSPATPQKWLGYSEVLYKKQHEKQAPGDLTYSDVEYSAFRFSSYCNLIFPRKVEDSVAFKAAKADLEKPAIVLPHAHCKLGVSD